MFRKQKILVKIGALDTVKLRSFNHLVEIYGTYLSLKLTNVQVIGNVKMYLRPVLVLKT